MQSDYSVNVFSRRKGKTRSFNLSRRLVYYPVLIFVLLVASSVLFGRGFFYERKERRRLENRVLLLGKSMNRLEDRVKRQEKAINRLRREQETKTTSDTGPIREAEEPNRRVAAVETRMTGSTPPVSTTQPAYAEIDTPQVSPSEGDSGFLLEFKLTNLAAEPISGVVVVVAALKPPHQPRFVSYPQMQLVNGIPKEVNRPVNFYIRRFKNVSSKFDFPFSYAESFRILIYDAESELVSQTTLNPEEIGGREFSAEEFTPVSESE
jgi:hypothetical protein